MPRCLLPAHLQAAARLLHQLLSMGASGGLPGLAALLQQLPAPSAAAASAAELPPAWEGLSDAQRAVVAALPLFHELLESLLKPSCAKELELLCGGLELLAAVVPPPFAAKIAGWAVEGLESVADLKLAAAAKALLQLALRARAAAASPATAAGSRAGSGSGRMGGGGGPASLPDDDVALLQAVYADLAVIINTGKCPIVSRRRCCTALQLGRG
jgi:hypothetical protein